jgi:hypothetical protein
VTPSGDPYAALVALAEREHALVAGGHAEELAALAAERTALVAGLPGRPPASARPALERAASLQLATTAALRAALGDTRRRLGAVEHGHRAARAYTRA